MVRGPNVRKNYKSSALVVNIDIAPTILDMAGITTSGHDAIMDGSSFLSEITQNSSPDLR